MRSYYNTHKNKTGVVFHERDHSISGSWHGTSPAITSGARECHIVSFLAPSVTGRHHDNSRSRINNNINHSSLDEICGPVCTSNTHTNALKWKTYISLEIGLGISVILSSLNILSGIAINGISYKAQLYRRNSNDILTLLLMDNTTAVSQRAPSNA